MNYESSPSIPSKEPKELQVSPDLSGLLFRIANGETDIAEILQCRWRGYKKFSFASPECCRDEFDERAAHYVSRDSASGEVAGCLRMLSRFKGRLELESFVAISNWVEDGACPAELARFSVPLSKRRILIREKTRYVGAFDEARRDLNPALATGIVWPCN